MTRFTTDPLLGIARIVTIALMGLMVFLAAVCTLAIPVVLFNDDAIRVNIDGVSQHPEAGTFYLVALLLAAVIALLVMLFVFFRHLKRIIESVAIGDPFVPENARRLTAMAWLMLAIQLALIPIVAMGLEIGNRLGEVDAEGYGGLDLSGIVMVIVLFILARVFRTGAAMREDLEGTV